MLNTKGMRFPIDVILVRSRWVIRFLPLLEKVFHKHKRPLSGNWRMNETYIKVSGQWKYLYRAVDKVGKTVDFLLPARRDKKAAMRFFEKAMRANEVPEKVAMDKSGANQAAIDQIIENKEIAMVVRQVKYINNIVEQDHRAIKPNPSRVTGSRALEPTLVFLSLTRQNPINAILTALSGEPHHETY